MKAKFLFLFMGLFLLFLSGCGEKTYTVNFLVDGEIVKTEVVKEGDKAIAPIVNETEDGYILTGWDQEFDQVKSDLDINAIMELKNVKVTFMDEDDNILKEEVVKYNGSVRAPKIPLKNGYNFIKWDNEYRNVKKDVIIHPIYELANYTIKYFVDDKLIKDLEPSTYTIESGASITLPTPLEKNGYKFIGWFEGDNRVVTFLSSEAENKIFRARYEKLPDPFEIPSDCTFMFKGIKSQKHSQNPNLTVYQPDFTGLSVDTSVLNYNWSSLQPEIATISMYSTITGVSTGYAIIRCEHKTDPNTIGYVVIKVNADGIFLSSVEESKEIKKYTVTFTDEQGKKIYEEEVEEYNAATLPTPPKKEGYTFVGWSGEHFNIKENITLEPIYKKGESDYVGKKVSIIGDSITTYTGYIPEGYASFFPYPTADVNDVNQTWWMKVINSLGMKLLKNNSYAGSCVSTGTGDSASTNDDRLKETIDGNTKPDIIFIFMGANDCASSYITKELFSSSYNLMLDKLNKLTKSEIYLLPLPKSKMYNENKRLEFNKVITDIAKESNLKVLDISNVFNENELSSTLVDSIHPNKLGMKKISDKIITDLLSFKNIK